jgi:hypothetical protein
VAAPCYFKIEPGDSEENVYTAWADSDFHERLVRHKVRHAAILLELAAQTSPQVKPSPRGTQSQHSLASPVGLD